GHLDRALRRRLVAPPRPGPGPRAGPSFRVGLAPPPLARRGPAARPGRSRRRARPGRRPDALLGPHARRRSPARRPLRRSRPRGPRLEGDEAHLARLRGPEGPPARVRRRGETIGPRTGGRRPRRPPVRSLLRDPQRYLGGGARPRPLAPDRLSPVDH